MLASRSISQVKASPFDVARDCIRRQSHGPASATMCDLVTPEHLQRTVKREFAHGICGDSEYASYPQWYGRHPDHRSEGRSHPDSMRMHPGDAIRCLDAPPKAAASSWPTAYYADFWPRRRFQRPDSIAPASQNPPRLFENCSNTSPICCTVA